MIDVMDERQITTRTTKIAEASAPCRTSKKLINRLVIIGGKDNFPADRQAAAQIQAAFPHTPAAAVQNRAFLVRTSRNLAQAGIRQFLDIGTGIPTRPNLHEVVQAVAPESRVVYADNDPIVVAPGRATGQTAHTGRDLWFSPAGGGRRRVEERGRRPCVGRGGRT
jgi:hypothetical protein